MADYEIPIFSMVWYNKYEYLKHDVFLWNNKKKMNWIMNNLKFCESFDVCMDNIIYHSIWDVIYMRILCTESNKMDNKTQSLQCERSFP